MGRERLFQGEFELEPSQPFTPLAGAVFCGNSVIVNAVFSAYGDPGLTQKEVGFLDTTAGIVELGWYLCGSLISDFSWAR